MATPVLRKAPRFLRVPPVSSSASELSARSQHPGSGSPVPARRTLSWFADWGHARHLRTLRVPTPRAWLRPCSAKLLGSCACPQSALQHQSCLRDLNIQARGRPCQLAGRSLQASCLPVAPWQLRFGILPALAAKAGSIGTGDPSRSNGRRVLVPPFSFCPVSPACRDRRNPRALPLFRRGGFRYNPPSRGSSPLETSSCVAGPRSMSQPCLAVPA
jgi:hypothetical protein